jgi:hypothetical protein
LSQSYFYPSQAVWRNSQEDKKTQLAEPKDSTGGNMNSVNPSFNVLLDHLKNVAEHHLVFKWTTVHPKVEHSPIVASFNLADLKPSTLMNTLHTVLTTLKGYGLGVCLLVGDGAEENVSFFKSICTVPISRYIPEELQKKYATIPYEELLFVALHPVTDEPIFVIEDMPHLMKRIVKGMERLSNPYTKRPFCWGDCPINLNMIWQVWESQGGRLLHLKESKLTMAHFVKDANSRMRVYLAVQVLSGTSAQMIEEAIKDDEIDLPLEGKKYKHLIELARCVDRLVDIGNGRSTTEKKEYVAHFKRETSKEIQEELLQIADWFAQWSKDVENDAELDENNFLADKTWEGLQWMMLGCVGMIEHYVKKKGFVIAPRRTTSDPVEQHFGSSWQSFGSSRGGTAAQADAADDRADLFRMCRAELKSNNGQAPVLFGKHNRKKYYKGFGTTITTVVQEKSNIKNWMRRMILS